MISVQIFQNFDLWMVGIVVSAIGMLGFIIYLSNPKSATNRNFLMLSVVTICYAVLNYVGYQKALSEFPLTAIWLIRSVIAFAVLHSFLIFHFFYIFPSEDFRLPRWYIKFILPGVLAVTGITLTPFVFKSIESYTPQGNIGTISYGPAIPIFGLSVIGFVIAGFIVVLRKLKNANPKEHLKLSLLLVGAIITYSLLITFNYVFPTFMGDIRFIPYAPLFISPFIFFTAYSILKYGLLQVKVIATEIFIFILSVVSLLQVLLSRGLFEISLRFGIFVLVLIFGFLVIKSVYKEILAGEEIKKLAKKLTETNWELAKTNERLRIIDQRKSEFVSIVSHQLRTPITAIKGYTSLLLEDAYGTLTNLQKTQVEKVFTSSSRLARMVNDFLDISKIEQGTMAYDFTEVDTRGMLTELIEDFRPIAEKKGLALNFSWGDHDTFIAHADAGKLRQIFSNIIDNAIKYTPKGGVAITLENNPVTQEIICHIKDTGIGLSQDDLHHLFGKFSRGSQGQSQNTDGSGLGLYVALKMLEAMKGKVWVDSEGPGKGSTFVIVLSKI